MNEIEAERFLRSLELFGMRFGLDRMRRLMTALQHPERRFRSIHVVGTNGKSSTTRMIAAILARHGLRTGPICRRTSSPSVSASASTSTISSPSALPPPSPERPVRLSWSTARPDPMTASPSSRR